MFFKIPLLDYNIYFMFYTYVYLNVLKPGHFKYDDMEFDYEPFYVGKGKDDRYLHHLNKVKNNYKYKSSLKFSIIEENVKNGKDPIIIKIQDDISEDESLSLEKLLIRKIGRFDLGKGPLTNLNDGGHKPQVNYRHSEETKNKISETNKKRKPDDRYDLISPEGIFYKNIKLLDFCKKHNLNYDKIRKSSNNGKIRVSKNIKTKKETLNCEGWVVINNKIENKKEKKIKYTLISSDNITYTIYSNESGIDFCKKLNLDFRLLRLYKNKGIINIRNIDQCKKIESKNCQGWEFIDHVNENKEDFSSKRKLIWKVISPKNETTLISNLKEFCEKNELSERTLRTFKNRGPVNLQMRKNYNKKIEKTIGWSCYSL
jgi:hypothetical protein